jgi:uncharacterized protein
MTSTTPTLEPGAREQRTRRSREATDRSRGRRWTVRLVLALVLVLALAYAAVGWYVSGEIIAGLRVDPPTPIEYDTEVMAVGAAEITLRRPDEADLEADHDAVMGLRWSDGYGQIGPAVSADGGLEVRPFTLLDGSPPPLGADVVDVDSFAFPPDPARLDLAFETVTFPAPLGDLEAWFFPGRGRTWVVAVHGGGADRHEFLRLVGAIAPLEYPALITRYRNDPGAPTTEGSLILAGQAEWPDVGAAIAYARANGADDVVLAGASMGGALVLGYLVEGDVSVVRGVILEAPNADLRETVRLRSGEALPIGGLVGDSILAVGRGMTWLRTGLDFDAVDYVGRADELVAPVLLHQGTLDRKLPVEIGDALAAARPDLIEYHRVDGGAHVRAWNEDPVAYAGTVTAFLERIGRSE